MWRRQRECYGFSKRVMGMFFLKLLAASLWEGWIVIKRDYHASKLSLQYNPRLKKDAQDAIAEIKRYFSQPSHYVKTLRDKHANHYDSAAIEAELAGYSPDETLTFVAGTTARDSLYSFADDCASLSMLKAIDPVDQERALERLFDEVGMRLPALFITFIDNLCTRILADVTPVTTDVELLSAPALSDTDLPYFVTDTARHSD